MKILKAPNKKKLSEYKSEYSYERSKKRKNIETAEARFKIKSALIICTIPIKIRAGQYIGIFNFANIGFATALSTKINNTNLGKLFNTKILITYKITLSSVLRLLIPLRIIRSCL